MTRKEEIKMAAEFAKGAEWADEHAVSCDGKAALYFNNIVYENGYNEAVDKACEWLTRELCYTARGNNFFNNKTATDEFVESFKKAMNNGCGNDGKLIINVYAHVRYWQDSKINGVYDDPEDPQMPCVAGADDDKYWVPKIEADTGLILNWTPCVEASINYKVCDECELTFTKGDAVVSKYDGYVPDFLCLKEEGYGDYIIMDIDSNGYIKNWDKVKDNIEI